MMNNWAHPLLPPFPPQRTPDPFCLQTIGLALDPTFRKGHFKLLNGETADMGLLEAYEAKGEPLYLVQPRVGNLRSGETQRRKLLQPFKVLEPAVSDLCAVERKPLEVRQSAQPLQVSIIGVGPERGPDDRPTVPLLHPIQFQQPARPPRRVRMYVAPLPANGEDRFALRSGPRAIEQKCARRQQCEQPKRCPGSRMTAGMRSVYHVPQYSKK